MSSNLEKICCASNGLVYITTHRGELLIQLVHQDRAIAGRSL